MASLACARATRSGGEKVLPEPRRPRGPNRFVEGRHATTGDVFELDFVPGGLDRLGEKLARVRGASVEIVTHPGAVRDYELLTSDIWRELLAPYRLGSYLDLA